MAGALEFVIDYSREANPFVGGSKQGLCAGQIGGFGAGIAAAELLDRVCGENVTPRHFVA